MWAYIIIKSNAAAAATAAATIREGKQVIEVAISASLQSQQLQCCASFAFGQSPTGEKRVNQCPIEENQVKLAI